LDPPYVILNYKQFLNPDKEAGRRSPKNAPAPEMTTAAQEYLHNNFTLIRVLKQTDQSSISIVSDADKIFYVLKQSRRTGLPYRQLQELQHPALPRIYSVQETDGETTVLEEYINGKNLAALTAAGPLPEKQVQDIALQICQALTFLHGHKILHRDIKPSNIIQQPDGRVKLIDFDAARTLHEDAASDTRLLGTKGFAPPEQYGFAQTDGRSDLFALGKTMAVLLGPTYHGRLTPIIKKATQIDAAQRYADAAGMSRALQQSTWRYAGLHYLLPGLAILLVAAGIWSLGQRQLPATALPAAGTSLGSTLAGRDQKANDPAAAKKQMADAKTALSGKPTDPEQKNAAAATSDPDQTADNKTAASRPQVNYIPIKKGDLAITYTNPRTGRTLPLRMADYDNAILLPTPRDFTATFTITNKSAYTLKHPVLVFYKDRLTARGSTALDRNDKLTNLPLAGQLAPGASVTATITFYQLELLHPVANFLIFVAADALGTAPENFYLIFWEKKNQGKGVDW
jgi:hypothetical protein